MEQKSRAIGTNTYLVTQMDAISALKIQTKLIKILGPGAVGLEGKALNTTQELLKVLPKVLPALLANVDDKLVNETILSLFEKGVFVEVDGKPKVVDFATHFTGKAQEMWKVALFILEVNFSMGELLGSILPTTKEDEETQENIT